MNKIKSFFVGLIIAISAVCSQAQTDLLTPLGSFASLQGIDGYSVGKMGYYQNTDVFKWAVSNWGAPVNMKPKRSYTYNWSISNDYSRVQHFQTLGGANHVWELAQSNVTGPCNNEVDLFLGMDVLNQNKTLATMGELKFDLDLERTYTDVQYGCMGQGYWDYGEWVASIMFVTNEPPHQILFYQVSLGINRLDYPGGDPLNPNVDWCPWYDYTDAEPFYRQYCLGDDVRNFNGVRTYENMKTENRIDLLARVTEIIRAGHTKAGDPNGVLETDLNKWRISGVYVGQIIQGKVVIDSRWSNVALKYRDGGQFCSGTEMVQWTCDGNPGNGWNSVGGQCYHKPTGKVCQ